MPTCLIDKALMLFFLSFSQSRSPVWSCLKPSMTVNSFLVLLYLSKAFIASDQSQLFIISRAHWQLQLSTCQFQLQCWKISKVIQKLTSIQKELKLNLQFIKTLSQARMPQKYQSILSLYIKHTPQHSKNIVEKNFSQAGIENRANTDKMFYMMERYMSSLQTHREYLEFFQIGVVRDNKKKIQNVAKYVGLAIREVEDHFKEDPEKKDAHSHANNHTTSHQKTQTISHQKTSTTTNQKTDTTSQKHQHTNI